MIRGSGAGRYSLFYFPNGCVLACKRGRPHSANLNLRRFGAVRFRARSLKAAYS